MVKGIFTLVNTVFQVIRAQADLDDDVKSLLAEMDDACKLAKEHAPLEGVANHTNIIVEQILAEVVTSANVIALYVKKRSSSKFS